MSGTNTYKKGSWTRFALLKSLKKSRCSDTFSFSNREADLNAKASTSSWFTYIISSDSWGNSLECELCKDEALRFVLIE